MAKSFERPHSPVGRYSYKGTMKINELAEWLVKEHAEFITSQEAERTE